MHIQWYFKVLVGVLMLVAITYFFLAWLVYYSPRQEAAGQELTVPAVSSPPASATASRSFPLAAKRKSAGEGMESHKGQRPAFAAAGRAGE